MRFLTLALMVAVWLAPPLAADQRQSFLDLARQGWNYRLRTTMVGRDMSIPVQINGRSLAGASLCLVGERPDSLSLETLTAFRGLIFEIFGKPLTMRYAGAQARMCGTGRTVMLRLFSGVPPHRDLSDDLNWLSDAHDLGLPGHRSYFATGPAMGQTFFGRRGQGTHIMVKQASTAHLTALERIFYRSILIEELFQSFTFGMDILMFDTGKPFQSKLQEVPMDLRRFRWESVDFMRGMVRTNPTGLCAFDVLMLYAVARAPMAETTDPAFLGYIEGAYDTLLKDAGATLADPRYAAIMAPSCERAPD